MKLFHKICACVLWVSKPIYAQNFSKQVKKIEIQIDKEKFDKFIKDGEKLTEQFPKKSNHNTQNNSNRNTQNTIIGELLYW